MVKRALSAFLWILGFQIIACFLGFITKMSMGTWYETLNKSLLTPPDFIFAIVWGVLYVMLALAGWSLWQKRDEKKGKLTFMLFAIQMVMNWLWTPIFFTFHFIHLGFYLIVAMVVITLVVILLCWNYLKLASAMLIPYWFWLLFAGYLNWVILLKN